DRVQRADAREMHGVDRRDHADVRTGDRRELRDLAADVHAHLENRRLVLAREAQDGQGQPDLVVLVALALDCPLTGREDGGDRVLRRGLRDRAGDSYNEWIETRPPRAGDPVQGGQRVRYPYDAD